MGLELIIPCRSSQGEVLEGFGPVGSRGVGLVGHWEAGTGWWRAKRTPDKRGEKMKESKSKQEAWDMETEEEKQSQY